MNDKTGNNKKKAGRPKGAPNKKKVNVKVNQPSKHEKINKALDEQSTVEDNTGTSFAMGMSHYLYKQKIGQNPIVGRSISEDELTKSIMDYLNSLSDIPVSYTSNQFKQDLIILLKSGTGGVATILAETMGFNRVDGTYKINCIDFNDIELKRSQHEVLTTPTTNPDELDDEDVLKLLADNDNDVDSSEE